MTILEDLDRDSYYEARRIADRSRGLDDKEFGRLVEMMRHERRRRAYLAAAMPLHREVAMLLALHTTSRYVFRSGLLEVLPPEHYLTGDTLQAYESIRAMIRELAVTYGMVEVEGPPAPSPLAALPPHR